MAVDEAALDQFLQDHNPEAGDTTPAPAAEEPTPQPEPEVEAPEVDDEPPADQDKFDRAYVEKLRRESANYRERAKKYQEAFDGYDDEAVSEWLRLAQGLRSDPRAAAAELEQLVQQVNEMYAEQEAQAEAEAVQAGEFLSRAEVERMFKEREEKAEIERRVARIESDATELGYKLGTPEYDELLWYASRSKDGSIQRAHEALEARNQAIYDRMIEKLNQKPNPRVPSGGTPSMEDRKLKTFEEANEALEAWLAGQG